MKTLTQILVFSILALAAVSCFQVPIKKFSPVNNKTYEVHYLFEHDGCRVYRFDDLGNHVYFTNCHGDVTSIKSDSTQTRTVNSVKKFEY